MPRGISRIALHVPPHEMTLIRRAAERAQIEVSDFIMRAALREARSIVQYCERVQLSDRDSDLVLGLLKSPPAPNAKLRRAAGAFPSAR